jgi:DNA-binding transcriptional LysR family regulator
MLAFLDLHPELQVEMVFNDRNIDLIEHGVDLALRIGSLPDTSMVARRVGTVGQVIVASPAYLARAGTPRTPYELGEHDVIFSSAARSVAEWRFRQEGRDVTVKLDPRLTVNEIDAVVMAVLAGRGIGRTLSYQVADQLADGSLVQLLQDYAPPATPVQLVMQSGRYLPARLRACVDFLAERLGALPVLQAGVASSSEALSKNT